MKLRKIFITLLALIIQNLLFSVEYYVEILCDEQKDFVIIKDVLKKQAWIDKDSITIKSDSILVGPYELDKVNKIKEKINSDLNISANIIPLEEQFLYELSSSTNVEFDQEEVDIELTSNTKVVDDELLNTYTDNNIKQIISYAMELYATPYKWGGENVDKGIDCSFFVKYVYSRLGIVLPRTSREQVNVGIPVDDKDLRCGDLLFFKKSYYKKVNKKYKRFERIYHVGIYLKDKEFIHASRGNKKVTISSLEEPYYKKHYSNARRLLNQEENNK